MTQVPPVPDATAARRPSWPLDAFVAMVMVVGLVISVAFSPEHDARDPGLVGYLVASLIGVVLLWRRRWPLQVLVVSVVLLIGYYVAGFPSIGALWPIGVAVFTVAEAGMLRGASIVGGLAVAHAVVWRLVADGEELSAVVRDALQETTLVAALMLAGYALRSRRLLGAEHRQRLELLSRERDRHARRRVTAERMRIARELHDIVAHTVAVIGIQARVASEAIDDDPQAARGALSIISDATRQATGELHTTVSVLRDGTGEDEGVIAGFDDLEPLAEAVNSGGVSVDLEVSGDLDQVAFDVQHVVYRIVQEALTNVIRHARATAVLVKVLGAPEGVVVRIADDGIGADAPSGYGIAGMRERVEAVGGTLSIGRIAPHGLLVDARLPREPVVPA